MKNYFRPMKTFGEKRPMKKIILVILCGLCCLASQAQAAVEMMVQAKYNGSAVQLRWVPLDKELGYQYQLYRAPLIEPQKRQLLATLSMPTYAEAKTRVSKENEYGLKLLYPFETAENRAEINAYLGQMDNRLNMVLFLSIFQPEIAELLGQAYIDTTVEKDIAYSYTLETYGKGALVSTKTLAVATYKPAVIPMAWGVKAHKFPWGVGLKWQGYEEFQGFHIYRAENYAGPYTQINQAPVQVQTAVNPDGTVDVAPYFYTDTTMDKDKTYYYKVRGLDFFGDLGPDSDIAMGKVKVDPHPGPPSRPTLEVAENSITLQWQKSADDTVMGYHVHRSSRQEGPYVRLNEALIVTTSFVDEAVEVDRNYFYTLTAVNNGGYESMRSLAALGVPVDSTPPPVVEGLGVELDEATVKLQWAVNPAEDLLGYRVYRTMTPELQDWALLNKEPVAQVAFDDALTKNLSRYPYFYRITAVDTHYNESAPSEQVKIQLPDVIPPSAPTIQGSSVREGQVSLAWTVINVYDFAGYSVYRSEAGKKQKISSELLVQPTFVDATPPVDTTLVYTVVAVDQTGNESEPSDPMTLTVRDHIKPRIASFEAGVEKGKVVLTLVSKDTDLAGFDVWRSRNNRDFIKINTRRVKEPRFTDEHTLAGLRSFYKIILWDKAANKTESVVRELVVQ